MALLKSCSLLSASLLTIGAIQMAHPQSGPGHRLEAFTYKDVALLGGPMEVQEASARSYFLKLNEDSLLQGFRLRAGLPAPGKPMGGWYDPDGFAGAHPFGQYVSALARMYAGTGDPRFKEKVSRLVHGFHLTLRSDGYFYSSAKVAKEWPCYLYDKNCIGMRDAYNLTGNKEALTVLSKMTDWAVPNLPRRSDEWYTLPENLYKCFELTKEPRYLKMAAEFDYSTGYYDDFASGKNAFTESRHAYSHVNSLSSAGKAYEFGKGPKYLTALENAWTFLTETQMYASGGWGPDERFVPSGSGKLSASLDLTEKSFETPCGAYANVNLDRYLLRFTGDPKYGDNMERVLLNGMLASLPPQADGHSFYYSNYKPGGKKQYFPDVWPCCSGTYAEITADYPTDVYFHSASGLYVNLFTPSKVRWARKDGAISVQQSTGYPLSPTTQLSINLNQPTKFSLNVRIPAWVTSLPGVKVNGRPFAIGKQANHYVRMERVWHPRDVVDIAFPMPLRLEEIDKQNPDRVALMIGPLLYVALANEDLSLDVDRKHLSEWIRRDPTTHADFRTKTGQVFRPLYLVNDERYTTYWHLKK